MDARQPLAHRGGERKAGAGHAQGLEHMPRQVLAQPLPAGLFDEPAGPVDADAVVPALAGVEEPRGHQRRAPAARHQRQSEGLLVAAHLRVPGVIAEAGGVGEQVAQRDRPARRAGDRPALRIEALEHRHARELGQPAQGRRVELEQTAFDQLHGRRGRDRLGHRGDPADRVQIHGLRLAQGAHAEGALVAGVVQVGDHGGHARHLARLHRRRQRGVDPVLQCHRHSPGRPWRPCVIAATGGQCTAAASGIIGPSVQGERR